MTLLDNLTSQLTPERKERFIGLFRQLQVKSIEKENLYKLTFIRLITSLQMSFLHKLECY